MSWRPFWDLSDERPLQTLELQEDREELARNGPIWSDVFVLATDDLNFDPTPQIFVDLSFRLSSLNNKHRTRGSGVVLFLLTNELSISLVMGVGRLPS